MSDSSSTSAPVDSDDEHAPGLSRDEIDTVLAHCLENRTNATLVNLASAIAEEGCFSSEIDNVVSMHISAGVRPRYFREHTPVSISFTVGSMAYTTLSRVIRFDPSGVSRKDHSRVLLTRPRQISFLRCRRTLRVPIPKHVRLVADVQGSERLFSQCPVLDMSQTGIQLQLARSVSSLRPDDRVTITLRLAERQLVLPAIVRSSKADTCGLWFIEAEDNPGVEAQLRRWLSHVEREWLRTRQGAR